MTSIPAENWKFWPPQLDIQNSFYNLVKKMTSLEPKIKKSRTCCNFEILFPHPQLDIKFWNPQECWWQFFIIYISRYIPYLYTHKVWRTLKDTFDIPSHPSIPSVNKTFSGFFDKFPPVNWTCQIPFSRHNKMEKISNGPHSGSAPQNPFGE